MAARYSQTILNALNPSAVAMPNDSGVQLINPGVFTGAPVPEAEISLNELLQLLRAGWKTIVGSTLGFLIVGILYVLLIPPTYEANGLVQVEENEKSGAMSSLSDISSLLLGSPVETEAEIHLLQSRLVLDQVIDKLNLLIEATPKHFPIVGHAISRAYESSSHSGPSSPWLGMRSFAWGGEEIAVRTLEVPDEWLDKKFTLTASVAAGRYSLSDPEGNIVGDGAVGHDTILKTPKGNVRIFVTQLTANRGTRFVLKRLLREDVLKKLSDHLNVSEQGKQSGVIGISFSGKSSSFVSDVVNNIEAAYLKQNVERRSQDATASLDYLEQQLPDLKVKVDAAQEQLNLYQIKHGSVDVTTETQLALQQAVDLETQRLQLIQQREEALQRFTPSHPVILGLNGQIERVVSEQQKLQEKEEKLPKTQQEVFSYMRDLDVATQLYTQLMNTIQELQVAKAGTIGNVRIVDDALKPFKPAQPKLPLILGLSAFLGALLGAIWALVRRALLRGIDDPAQVEQRLGLTIYAAIPYVQEQRRITRGIQRRDPGTHILAAVDSGNPAVEALRSLRTSLHFALLEASNNVVMLTGPVPGLGKSFLSINLGAVLAGAGKRIVVVDADLRRGQLHKYIGTDAAPGLADYIAGDADQTSVLRPSGVDNMWTICHGTTPPNAADLLLHERFGGLIGQLSKEFDYVIVDAPPVLLVADPAIIGRQAGTTLVVLKSAEHPMREIEETVRRLANAGVKVRGILFNQMGARAGSYGYGQYGYSYTHYRYDN